MPALNNPTAESYGETRCRQTLFAACIVVRSRRPVFGLHFQNSVISGTSFAMLLPVSCLYTSKRLCIDESSTAGRYDYDYLVCVHRAHTTRYEVYPRSIQQPLPCIRIPLAGNDPDVGLEIRAALEQAYDAGRYDQRIDYAQPCQPPLSADIQA